MKAKSNDHILLSPDFRSTIENTVSSHLGKPWLITFTKNLNDRACHPAAILSDGKTPVFVKLSQSLNGLEQFQIEQNGLARLTALAGVQIPTIIAVKSVFGGYLMIMEAVQEIKRTPLAWRQIGYTLAEIHKIKGESCGHDTQGYIGPWYQDNRLIKQWSTFFAERRLWPALSRASDSGHLTGSMIRELENILKHLPELCGPEPIPTLLHGDAQQNNYISTPNGTVVIDPAVCYGHPEFDLAMIDYFQPVPDDVFAAYKEIHPIQPGFETRKHLWRLYGYLAAVTIEGRGHLPLLSNALKKVWNKKR